MLIEWDVPKDRVSTVLELIKENGKYANMFSDTKGGLYVVSNIPESNLGEESNGNDEEGSGTEIPNDLLKRLNIGTEEKTAISVTLQPDNNRVFISHGKNKNMVEGLKELLKFGGFEPIVSVERETTAISVPEKVFSDMRSCCAGIIHIEEEKVLIGEDSKPQKILNENVLIEIGAAIALYDKKIILLCKKGISLPSNLQGLYRCEYDGDKLDTVFTKNSI